MREAKEQVRARGDIGPDYFIFGVVVFARGPVDDWVTPLIDAQAVGI
jgi:hypothetical protein